MDENGAGGSKFDNDYLQASGKNTIENQSADSSDNQSDNVPRGAYGARGMSQFDNHASQISMHRNGSDFNAGQRTVPKNKSGKYNSIERNGMMDENQVSASPMIMKKKANVHLQPMSHKKAHMMQTGLSTNLKMTADVGSMGHSESNPLLQP